MVVRFLCVVFLLNAELSRGTCLAGLVVQAMFFESAGVVML
jgi:hypothetical protein